MWSRLLRDSSSEQLGLSVQNSSPSVALLFLTSPKATGVHDSAPAVVSDVTLPVEDA